MMNYASQMVYVKPLNRCSMHRMPFNQIDFIVVFLPAREMLCGSGMNTQPQTEENATLRLIDGKGLPMDPAAIDQLTRTAGHPSCKRAVGLPDLHPGNGIPLGAAFALKDEVRPALIGTDIGCGVLLLPLDLTRVSLDKLERRLRQRFDAPIFEDWNLEELGRTVWQQGVRALIENDRCPLGLRESASKLEADPALSSPLPPLEDLKSCARSLGTIGGGNHFVEIARVAKVDDESAGEDWGLLRGRYAILVHSGSRRFGDIAARRWGNETLQGARIAEYMSDLAAARQAARVNRLALAYTALAALGEKSARRVGRPIDLVHNDIVPFELEGESVWLHRKGAAPALANEPTVILGSRGARSYVLMGKNVDESLRSVAHGAGRRICRAEARTRFKQKYTRASLERTAFGGRVICDDMSLLFEEHPDAYKPIDRVIEALCEADIARPLAALEPVVTVKK